MQARRTVVGRAGPAQPSEKRKGRRFDPAPDHHHSDHFTWGYIQSCVLALAVPCKPLVPLWRRDLSYADRTLAIDRPSSRADATSWSLARITAGSGGAWVVCGSHNRFVVQARIPHA